MCLHVRCVDGFWINVDVCVCDTTTRQFELHRAYLPRVALYSYAILKIEYNSFDTYGQVIHVW